MAANFKANRGLQDSINRQQIQDGNIWFAEDSQNLFIDSLHDGLKRIQITDVIDLSVSTPTKYYQNKLYIDKTKLKKYNESTNSLEVISELDSEVIESSKEFVYDTTNISKATLANTSSPKKGTIVIDKNGDVGVVIDSTTTTLNINVIANNKFKNILTGYDIYVDSNYAGNEVGTFNCPFKTWSSLYDKCESLLLSDDKITIHIKANSTINVTANKFNSCKYLTITGDSTSFFNFDVNDEFLSLKFITFENINIGSVGENLSFNTCSNIIFNNIYDLCYIGFIDSSNITINNVQRSRNIVITKNTNHININNLHNNLSNNFQPPTINIFDTVDGINSGIRVRISNSTLSSLRANNGNELSIINTTIFENLSITGFDTVSFNSGELLNETNNKSCTISATNINLGTFNFNGANTQLNGTINNLSGLSSKQIYDTNNRTYNNNNPTLESHLNAIDNLLDIVNTKVNVVSEEGSGLVESFISKDTFKVASDLNNKQWRTGDVMKYIGTTPIKLSKTHDLQITKLLEVMVEVPGEPSNGQPTIGNKRYFRFWFNFVNANYISHKGDIINIVYYNDNKTYNFELPIDSIDKNNVTCMLEKSDKTDILTPFDETNEDEIAKYISITFTHEMTVNPDDRIIYIKNDWDKLVSSNNNEDTNYKIVNTYSELYSIMTDDTRPVGLLAYVVENKTIYQWVDVGDSNQWVNFTNVIESKIDGFVPSIKSTTDTINIDELTTEGMYEYHVNNVNSSDSLPVFQGIGLGNIYGFIVKSLKGSSVNNCCVQLMFRDGSSDIFIRHYHKGSWSIWTIVKPNALEILHMLTFVDGTDSDLDADTLDGFHDIQFAKYGRADKSLINEKPTEFTSGGATMYYFYDVNNIIGEGATREYGIMQIYVDETHYVRLAISMSSGKVYRQASNISSVTAWNEISTSIPVLSADPSNPSEGQMWIIAS